MEVVQEDRDSLAKAIAFVGTIFLIFLSFSKFWRMEGFCTWRFKSLVYSTNEIITNSVK